MVKIVESISEEGDKIPLVLFSNGMGEAMLDKNNISFIREINKTIFYSHLFYFIDYLHNKRIFEMWILAWGKNFWSKEISILGATLLDLLTKYKGDDEFEVALLTDAKMEFLRFVNLSLEQDDISSVLDELTNNPLTIKEFRDKINLITESFLKSGKNIYPWK